MTTAIVPSISDEQLAEIEAAANAFPDYEWDSNTEPFFNGPSGESLGGGSTGFYCVYGQPFEIDGEAYDGPTLVEACPPSQAKFICEAKPTIKALIARLRAAEADAKRYQYLKSRCDDGFIVELENHVFQSMWDQTIDQAMERTP